MKPVSLAFFCSLMCGTGAVAQTQDAVLVHGFRPTPYTTTVPAGGGEDIVALSSVTDDIVGTCAGWIPGEPSFVFFYGPRALANNPAAPRLIGEDPLLRDRRDWIEIAVTGDVDLTLAIQAQYDSWCDSAGVGDNQASIRFAAPPGEYSVFVGTRQPNVTRRVQLTVREVRP